ncbi:MAG: OsmC family peroxiredoxin [Nitrososphaerota archaeon]
MSVAKSRASAVWEGDLLSGKGRVRPASDVFPELPLTWAARAERKPGTTSPEELLAAAHAGCFSMALSNILAKGGTPAERLEVSAEATFEKAADGFKVTSIVLDVMGRVKGITAEKFAEAAKQAGDGCPISKALKNNVEIRVNARLQ